MYKFFKKPFAWTIFYSLLLVLFTFYVILDVFVIPRKEQNVSGKTTTEISEKIKVEENYVNIETEQEKFDKDQNVIKYDDNLYEDENIKIYISKLYKNNTQIYIADVKIKSIDYLKTALAKNSYGRNLKQNTSEMAEEHNAILAINGDFYGFRDDGFVLRNSVLYRKNAGNGEALVIYGDGTFETVLEKKSDADELLKNGAEQILSFGPGLLSNGEICVDEKTEVARATNSNPRTAIGMIEPLHYIVVVADGRTDESKGLSLYQLAELFKENNCIEAYNLDGGGSATMYFNGKVVNIPTDGAKFGEREVSDIVYFGY